eukprot:451085-Prorocentrum_minimum.AAC.2
MGTLDPRSRIAACGGRGRPRLALLRTLQLGLSGVRLASVVGVCCARELSEGSRASGLNVPRGRSQRAEGTTTPVADAGTM